MEVNNGLSQEACHKNSDFLLSLARAYFVLQVKVLGFHWNVVGPHFLELHKFFEETYEQLNNHLDEIAERIRMLGSWAPMGVSSLTKDALLQDSPGIFAPLKMLEELQTDYVTLVGHIRTVLKDLLANDDETTKDLMTDHLGDHEKRLWMIRSLVQNV